MREGKEDSTTRGARWISSNGVWSNFVQNYPDFVQLKRDPLINYLLLLLLLSVQKKVDFYDYNKFIIIPINDEPVDCVCVYVINQNNIMIID